MVRMKIIRTIFLSLLVISVGSCAAKNPATGKTDISLMSEKQEWAVGHELVAKSIRKDGGLYTEKPELRKYMKDRMREVVGVTELSHKPFRFNLVDSDMVNAYAIPGYITFYRGILPLFENEAQMVTVMAHEAGHVTARHTVRGQTKGAVANILVNMAAIAVGQSTGSQEAADLTGNLSSVAAQLGLAGYSRAYEAEADELGVRYTSRLCYDASEGTGVHKALGRYKTLREKITGYASPDKPIKARGYHDLFASHPDSEKRVRNIARSQEAKLSCGKMVHKERYLQAIDGLAFGPKAKKGFGTKNAYYNKRHRFVFDMPRNWFVPNMEGLPDIVTKDGTVEVSIKVQRRPVDETPEETLIYQFNHAGIMPIKVQNDHGLTTYSGVVDVVKDTGMFKEKVGKARVFAFRGNRKSDVQALQGEVPTNEVITVTFQAEKGKFNELDDTFFQVAKSFRRLTRGKADQIEPMRIKIHTVAEGETEEDLTKNMAFAAFHKQWFRLINGRDIDVPTAFAPGEQVKLIVDPNVGKF